MHDSFNLFVYGTLREGSVAHGILAGCERLGEAVVRGIMYDIDGRYPAVILYGAAPIHGELWRCPAALLLRLDDYEGTPAGLFRRVATTAELADGGDSPCWIYTAGPALSRRLTPDARIESGRYSRQAGDDDVH